MTVDDEESKIYSSFSLAAWKSDKIRSPRFSLSLFLRCLRATCTHPIAIVYDFLSDSLVERERERAVAVE
jgi:hypothetical protein